MGIDQLRADQQRWIAMFGGGIAPPPPPRQATTSTRTPRQQNPSDVIKNRLRNEFGVGCTKCFTRVLLEIHTLSITKIRSRASGFAKSMLENAHEMKATKGDLYVKKLFDWVEQNGGESAYKRIIIEACDACEPPPRTDFVIDSNRHGFGDAILFSWVAEGAKMQGIKVRHYAKGKMADLLKVFQQEIVAELPTNFVNVNDGYNVVKRAHGKISMLGTYAKILKVDTPVRPTPIAIPSDVEQWASDIPSGKPSVILFPQSTRQLRTWPQNYWIVLASGLKERGFHPIVCCWGANAISWRQYVPDVLIDLPWLDTVALMQRAKACIGNNSGCVHVAGTLDIPTFVLSGLTTAETLEGIPSMIHVAVDKSECPCVGCYYAQPPRSKVCDIGCIALQSLTPAKVLEVFDRSMLQSSV